MKFTQALIRRIKCHVNRTCGRRRVEVGARHWPNQPENSDGYNFLLWGPGHDLDDVHLLANLAGQEVQDFHGWVALDLYLYNLPVFGVEPQDALDCNAYVLISPEGGVVYCSSDGLGHVRAIRRILAEHGVEWREEE